MSGRYEQACEALAVLGQRERQRDLAAAEEAFTAALRLADQHDLPLWRVRVLHELGTIDLIGGGPLERLAQARQAALAAGALATAATVSLQMAAWSINNAEPAGAVAAGRCCAAEAVRLRLNLVAGWRLSCKRWITPCWISAPRWRRPSTARLASPPGIARSAGAPRSWPGRCCRWCGRTVAGHSSSSTRAWSCCETPRSLPRAAGCGRCCMPLDCARHDACAFGASGLAQILTDHPTMADLGYIGVEGIAKVPYKRFPGTDLNIGQVAFNTSLSKTRAAVEGRACHCAPQDMANAQRRRRALPSSAGEVPLIKAVIGLFFFATYE